MLSKCSFLLESNENFKRDSIKRNGKDEFIGEGHVTDLMSNEIDIVDEDHETDVKRLVRSFQGQLSVIPCDSPTNSNNYADRTKVPDKGVIPWESDDEFSFSFDLQPKLSEHTGPSPSLILQSLTMSNSNDAINLERFVNTFSEARLYPLTFKKQCFSMY